VIFAWVQREYRNLMNAREAQVNVPIPITFANNILVLEFVGKNGNIAPRLKDEIPKNKKIQAVLFLGYPSLKYSNKVEGIGPRIYFK